jgi:elongation of very long chain fatty acids protein 6
MYTYYACRAMRMRIPKWVNMTITAAQLSQMVVGIYVNVRAYNVKQRGDPCGVSHDNIKWSFIMYGSYFFLFFHFFYLAYISKPVTPQHSVSNGKSVANGNGNGHTNGYSNGHANGHTNGHVNGHANGHVNGSVKSKSTRKDD